MRPFPLNGWRGNWQELPGLRGHGTGPRWQPGAGGMCLHTIVVDPRTLGGCSLPSLPPALSGRTTAARPGIRSTGDWHRRYIPDPNAEVDIAFTALRCIPPARGTVHAETLGRHAQRRCR